MPFYFNPSWPSPRLFALLTGAVLLACLGFTPSPLQAAERAAELTFYETALVLHYDDDMLLTVPLRIDETSLRNAYQQLSQKRHQRFHDDLQATATRLRLNDWLYSQLVQHALAQIYAQPVVSPVVQLNTYFFLSQRGYDVRLTYRDKAVGVYAYCTDQLYEVSTIESDGRKYAHLMHQTALPSRGQSFYLLDHRPQPDGRALSFLITEWPILLVHPQERAITFNWRGQTLELPIRYDAGIATLMTDYPLVDEYWYMDAPMSDLLEASLLPQLKELLANRPQAEQVSMLAAFTRSAFVYEDDRALFGKNKPLVGEELFFYPHSDCEDRSALFFALVKRLLNLPMLVITYDDHISIAVAIADFKGDAIQHNGRTYYFCDPTGPNNSDKIGVVPSGYEKRAFGVMGGYGE